MEVFKQQFSDDIIKQIKDVIDVMVYIKNVIKAPLYNFNNMSRDESVKIKTDKLLKKVQNGLNMIDLKILNIWSNKDLNCF